MTHLGHLQREAEEIGLERHIEEKMAANHRRDHKHGKEY